MAGTINNMMLAKRRLTPTRAITLGILVIVVLVFILLLREHPLDGLAVRRTGLVDRFFNQLQPLLTSKQTSNTQSFKPCQLYHIYRDRWTDGKELESAQCRRVLPVPGSCDVAEKLFHSSPPAKCDESSTDFCTINVTGQDHHVQCSDQKCGLPLFAATVEPHAGKLQWHKFPSSDSLEKWISSLLQPSAYRKHFGFCFIACGDGNEWTDEDTRQFVEVDYSYIYRDIDAHFKAIQLLLLPPSALPRKVPHQKSKPSLDININVIFLDSVSHQHFFRSLPKTVRLLETLAHTTPSNLTVFDFEIVQAVRSRTFETLQVLFSGEIDPSIKPFGVFELPPEPLKTEALLKHLKKKGYSTLWLEDLCYLWEWGLRKDLLVLNNSLTAEQTWAKLQQALTHAGIDSLEVTYAMCKLLSENGVKDHFHGPDAVCLNGRHQHDYLLDYLWLYQTTMETSGIPFFTFTETNVGHEESGKRIQTFDQSFHHYLKLVSTQKNTLTIIVSDHGNSYGNFLEKSLEGRIELFHPHLTMMIPDNVAAALGQSAMKALRVNQLRLVSHLDLHYMLKSLVFDYQNKVSPKHSHYKVSSRGLLDIVSANRSCNNIPRIMPNLCICQDFDMAVESDDYHALFAHLALGKINNEIQHQFHLQTEASKNQHKHGFGNCHRLHLTDFNNIRKSFGEGTISLKMDLRTPSIDSTTGSFHEFPISADEPTEVFFVAIQVHLNGTKASKGSIVLETADRITPYSKFSACVDSTVKLQLCVCELNATHKTEISSRYVDKNTELYFTTEMFVAEGTQDCLVLVVKKNRHGGVFSVANVCGGKVFHVMFTLQTSEMIVSDAMPREEQVFPQQELFLCMAVKNAPSAEWNWSFTLHHKSSSL